MPRIIINVSRQSVTSLRQTVNLFIIHLMGKIGLLLVFTSLGFFVLATDCGILLLQPDIEPGLLCGSTVLTTKLPRNSWCSLVLQQASGLNAMKVKSQNTFDHKLIHLVFPIIERIYYVGYPE